jgi:hypothetical protein
MGVIAINSYLLDAFKYPASAVAATTVIRPIAAALFRWYNNSLITFFQSTIDLGLVRIGYIRDVGQGMGE